ncbi:hypothetical protein QYF61_008804 [Mycteria americana]|uniref:Uncharacterized protein n=1 Tax=Mycteria americana TaxID=33587 RepID=A0AAN7N901_MYCAM|nr:hypothetical protein QYF61_008804 [Mycteria americana]
MPLLLTFRPILFTSMMQPPYLTLSPSRGVTTASASQARAGSNSGFISLPPSLHRNRTGEKADTDRTRDNLRPTSAGGTTPLRNSIKGWKLRKKRRCNPCLTRCEVVNGSRLAFLIKPVPMLHNPFSEVTFPNIQSKPPLEQLEAISSCPITCNLGEDTDPHLSTTSFQRAIRSPLSLRFSRLNNPSSLSRSSSDFCSRPFTSFVALLWTRSSTSMSLLYPAGHAIFDTSQDAIGFLGHLGTLLAHIQAAVNKQAQFLLCWAAFQPLFPKPVALHGVAVAQVQDLALGLVKPHTIDLGPSIQPVQVPLQSLPTLQKINTPTQLGVICKLAEGALDPFVQIIDKDIKQNWPQHRALGDTTCDRLPTGVNSIHHHSLGPAVQPVLYPEKSTPVQAMSSQFLQENAVGNGVKGFPEV